MWTPETITHPWEYLGCNLDTLTAEEAAQLTKLLNIPINDRTLEQSNKLEILRLMIKWLTREEAISCINVYERTSDDKILWWGGNPDVAYYIIHGLSREHAERLAYLVAQKNLTDLEIEERGYFLNCVTFWMKTGRIFFVDQYVSCYGATTEEATKYLDLQEKSPEDRTEDDWVTLRELHLKIFFK